jgi:predicted deacetylase
VPYCNKRYNLKDFPDFSNSISSTLQSDNNNVELSLHGLYHQADGQMDDFDTHTKEEEKNKIQQGLDIFSAAGLQKQF